MCVHNVRTASPEKKNKQTDNTEPRTTWTPRNPSVLGGESETTAPEEKTKNNVGHEDETVWRRHQSAEGRDYYMYMSCMYTYIHDMYVRGCGKWKNDMDTTWSRAGPVK